MVQEFHVLKCCFCQCFQVQQIKKVNRWSCKLCGQNQSLLKEFGRGSGADCRRHVQKLNATRGNMMEEEEEEHNTQTLRKQVKPEGEDEPEEHNQVTQVQVSRWSKYLDTPEVAEPEENVLMDRQQLHGNSTARKRKTRRGWTDRGGQDSCIPEQPKRSCLMVKPQATAKTTCLTHTSPPSKKSINPASVSTGPDSKWARVLSPHCQVKGGDGPSVGGWGQSVDTNNDQNSS